jgi:hypothetical protein
MALRGVFIMNHKEMTKHIRKRLAVAKINAKCRMVNVCGVKSIYIDVPNYKADFTKDEQKTICLIARVNGLTGVQKSEILNNGTNSKYAYFEFHQNDQ